MSPEYRDEPERLNTLLPGGSQDVRSHIWGSHLLGLPPSSYLFIDFWLCWVFMAVRGLSQVVASSGCSLLEVLRLLIAVASLVVEHRM